MPIGSALVPLHRVGQRRLYGSWRRGGSQLRLGVCDGLASSRSEVVRESSSSDSRCSSLGGALGAISIRCPATGELVSTGMSMERDSFYRSVLTGNSVKCPHCGITHIWTNAEAIID